MINQKDLLKVALEKFNWFWFRGKDKFFEYVRFHFICVTFT